MTPVRREGETALALRTVCCHVLGRPLPADPVTQVRQERARHPDLPAHDDPSIRLAAAILTTTDPRTAVEIHESARQRANTHGDDLGIAWLASRASLAAAAAGDWRRAEEVAASGLVAAERLGSPPALVYALTAVGACAALAGNDTVAEDAARRLDPFGSFMFAEPQAAVIRGHLAWADDRADRAAVLFDQAEAQLRRLDIVEPTTPFLRWHRADVLLDAGRPDEAAEEADRLLHLADTVGHPLALAVGHRVRARLDDDPERFATALARPQLHAWPFERALTQYYSGTVLRRLRRIRDARVALTDALGGFTRLGAIRWAERTSSEIARLGGRTARPGSLTAAESRVAELAVRGLTNQEIADELVISARTVASHLSSAYAKLGARSRTELASILTEGVGPAQR